jgi:hypothetical protein
MKAKLKARFDVTELGDSKQMLGMRITRDRKAHTIKLDQELYITKALEKFGLADCKPASTPAAAHQGNDEDDRDGAAAPTDLKLYQEKVGTLLYAAISTRPDIAHAVQLLTRHMQAPLKRHMHWCDRVFRYLSGTRTLGLQFGHNTSEIQGGPIISAYADADWAADKADRKSVTGWLSRLNGDLISWSSKKQSGVAISTCEAELYAHASAVQEVKWLQSLTAEIGPPAQKPSIVHCDNRSTIDHVKNGVRSERTKHIDIKYHFITDNINRGVLDPHWIPTEDQQADILTKSLGRQQFIALRDKIMTSHDSRD